MCVCVCVFIIVYTEDWPVFAPASSSDGLIYDFNCIYNVPHTSKGHYQYRVESSVRIS